MSPVRTTYYAHNSDGKIATLTAKNSMTGDQVTQWIYGTTLSDSGVASHELLSEKIFPGNTIGSPDKISYSYNRLGEIKQSIDQNGTVHAYEYDKLGRLEHDRVTKLGKRVDGAVRRISKGYEVRGMLQNVTSLDDAEVGVGNVVNDVLLTYDSFQNLVGDYQAHDGPVDPASTPSVHYAYADGSSNTVRQTGIIYPNGNQLVLAYTSTEADLLSRPDALQEEGSNLCSYQYLGMGTPVKVSYDAVSDLYMTYENGGTGDAGDKYTGLDRFGRLVETIWKNGSEEQVRSKYGRNRLGGIVWRRDEQAHSMGVDTEDNYYSYDGLYQVKQHQRGELMGTYPNYSGIIKPQQDEDWTYDPSGNWDKYSSQLPCNNQIRSQNQANEVTGITSPVGEVVPKYDATGNMITMPVKPGLSTSQYTLTWDGWNRLVEVSNEGSIIAAYIYDGKTRQISKSNINETRHYYFNTEWRALEERVEGASVTVDRKYAWGLIDRSDLVRRTRISGKAVLNEEIFLLRNGLDPVAITGSDGNVVERFGYDAFGEALFKGYDFSSHQDSVFNWNFLFHGEFLDENVKLYNYGYRYYFSQLGRWVNRDPLGELGFEVTRLDFVEHPNFNVDASQLVDDEDGDSTPELQRANSRTASGSQNQVRFMDYEWNRYAFVLNNPVQYTDADGLDITVETGNTGAGFINNGIHQQVCVGCGDNKRCFSFGKIPGLGGVQLPQFSKTWLGWNSWVTGAILRGEIYEADPVMGATIYSRHTTTGAQDSNWLQYMVTSRVGLQDAYSFARHNCRTYSQWEFGDAPKHW